MFFNECYKSFILNEIRGRVFIYEEAYLIVRRRENKDSDKEDRQD